jgi:hypothetical protein
VCKLEHPKGSTFSSKDISQFLDDLMYFLSFVRGLWVSPLLVTGYSHSGSEVWQEWGIRQTDSWKTVMSWFDPLHTTVMMPPVFEGYMEKLNDPKWNNVIKPIIYWYVESNTLRGIDGALILAQTALEKLAWNYLVIAQKCLDEKAFNHMKAAEKFRMLLFSCRIPVDLPAYCQELSQIAKEYKLPDGPSAITFIRNKTVHPPKSNRSFAKAYWESLQLALGYVELVLLNLFGYQGKYSNRLSKTWSGEVEDVPWVR